MKYLNKSFSVGFTKEGEKIYTKVVRNGKVHYRKHKYPVKNGLSLVDIIYEKMKAKRFDKGGMYV